MAGPTKFGNSNQTGFKVINFCPPETFTEVTSTTLIEGHVALFFGAHMLEFERKITDQNGQHISVTDRHIGPFFMEEMQIFSYFRLPKSLTLNYPFP